MAILNWDEIGLDPAEITNEGGENKVRCPKECSSHPRDRDFSANDEDGVYKCHNPGCELYSGGRLGSAPRRPKRDLLSEYYMPDRERYDAASDKLPTEIVAWFGKRGISESTLTTNGVDGSRCLKNYKTGEWDMAIRFPYIRDGELVNAKIRHLHDKSRMQMLGRDKETKKRAELIFYRLDHADESTIICEGEPDALSIAECGYDNVVSVPNGAIDSENPEDLKLDYWNNSQPWLDHVKRYIFFNDRDHPGKALRDELARRAGVEKCSHVDYDLVCKDGHGTDLQDAARQILCKDANDILMRHGADEVRLLIEHARPFPYDGIVRPSDLIDTVLDWYDHGMPTGLSTGYANLDEFWRVLEGEMTIITGVPSHGKSEFVDSLLLNLYELHGWRSTIFSPESYPEASHMAKLLEKVVGKPFDERMAQVWRRDGFPSQRMTRSEVLEATKKIDNAVSFISPGDGAYGIDDILERVQAEVTRRGIKVAVLDPWNAVEHSMDKGMAMTHYIGYALNKIRRFTRHYGIHFFVIAHPSKMPSAIEKYEDDDGNTKVRRITPPPNLYSISDSANWYNMADNGIVAWRDEQAKEHGANPHLNTIIIEKVKKKWVGHKGNVQLLWHPPSGRYAVPSGDDLGANSRPSSTPHTDTPFADDFGEVEF